MSVFRYSPGAGFVKATNGLKSILAGVLMLNKRHDIFILFFIFILTHRHIFLVGSKMVVPGLPT